MSTRSPSRESDYPERRRHRLPMAYYTDADHVFMFTLCARQHGSPFARGSLATAIVDALLWRKTHHAWTMFCYCLMPDHLHFVVRLSRDEKRLYNAGARGWMPAGLLDQIGAFKRYTTTQIWYAQGGTGALWQRSSYDRTMRADEPIDEAVHYVLNNPVRRGLVSRWEEYPYSAIADPW